MTSFFNVDAVQLLELTDDDKQWEMFQSSFTDLNVQWSNEGLNSVFRALEYEFKLERAKQEAERQRIEAEGKATANNIINASLTEKILREKGIEATERLAGSNNAKVVVVGSGKDGLPIILGGNN